MTPLYSLLIRDAHLRGRDGLWQIGLRDGRIAAIAERLDGSGAQEIDARGGLCSESFANAHLHLCKVYTLARMDEAALKDYHGEGMGKAMTAIELAARVKQDYDVSWILPNVRRALDQALRYGNLHIRAFADVDGLARLEGVKALIAAREEYRGVLDVQVVAFAQDGLVREPAALGLMRQALQLGADVVGGIPWIEYTDADIREHVRLCFDLAAEFDKPVSMLVDDAGDPGLRSLETMALETIARGWQGRSLAHHARAMALYPKPYFQKVAALLKKAGMAVVSDPHTGPLHARVHELLEEHVPVCLGQDDISDAYYPYGRNNMLEVAFLASHLLWMTGRDQMETLYEMVTTRAAAAMGVRDHHLEVGCPANLVVLEQPDVLEALREHAAPRVVISAGKIVTG